MGIIVPTDYIIFFRGVETTNQIMLADVLNCFVCPVQMQWSHLLDWGAGGLTANQNGPFSVLNGPSIIIYITIHNLHINHINMIFISWVTPWASLSYLHGPSMHQHTALAGLRLSNCRGPWLLFVAGEGPLVIHGESNQPLQRCSAAALRRLMTFASTLTRTFPRMVSRWPMTALCDRVVWPVVTSTVKPLGWSANHGTVKTSVMIHEVAGQKGPSLARFSIRILNILFLFTVH